MRARANAAGGVAGLAAAILDTVRRNRDEDKAIAGMLQRRMSNYDGIEGHLDMFQAYEGGVGHESSHPDAAGSGAPNL